MDNATEITDKSKEPCKFFNTKYGCKKENCKFLHVKVPKKNKIVCKFYSTDKGCLKGNNCTYLHIEPICKSNIVKKTTLSI